MKKEDHHDLLMEALRRYGLVSGINKKYQEIEQMKEEIKKLNQQSRLILFSEPVSFRAREASNGSMFQEEGINLDRMEISCITNSESTIYQHVSDFFLNLCLYSEDKCYSFVIARNKDSHAGYAVMTKESKLIIQNAGDVYVRFSYAEDFQRVISYCNECMAHFNDFLKEEDKLVIHINEPIVSPD